MSMIAQTSPPETYPKMIKRSGESRRQLTTFQMDIGVGSFVFSQGIVSAIPLVKNPTHLTAPLLPKLSLTLRKCSPVLLLGLLRTMSVKGTEYPVSDAALSLFVLREFSSGTCHRIRPSLEFLRHAGVDTHPASSFASRHGVYPDIASRRCGSHMCAPSVGLLSRLLTFPHTAHQLALSMGNLAQYILDAPRDGVIAANKEGIISLTGAAPVVGR